MSFIQENRVSFNELISGTFAELNTIRKELLIYFGAFALLGAVIYGLRGLLPGAGGLLALAGMVGYFIGQYWLYRELLGKAGLIEDGAMRVFRLFAMAVLIMFAVAFGLNFFFIPGIILAAKWVMAPAFLVSGNPSVMGSMGASWRASSGSTLALSLAFIVMVVIWFVAAGLLSGVSQGLGLGTENSPLVGFSLHILPVLLMGLSVTAFKHLTTTTPTLEDVFA